MTTEVPVGPSSLIWLVTGQCNLVCDHCYASRFPVGEELSTEEAEALVAEAARLGVQHLALAGGEPLLRPDLFEIIAGARSLGLGVSLVTNGGRVTLEAAQALARSGVEVVVSLDGARAQTHDRRRGVGSHRQALAALAHLRQAGAAYRTVMALGTDNYHEVGEYLTLAHKLGAEAACLIPVMPSGRAGRESTPTAAQVAGALQAAGGRSQELGLPLQLWCLPFAPLVMSSDRVSAYPCRGSLSMDIDPAGRILLCDVLDVEVSALRGRGLVGAWREQCRSPVVRRLASPKLAPVCADCPLAHQCRGGCYARARLLSGDLYAPDPLCPRVAGVLSPGLNHPD
jgi:radical SAM protein with 4Fe4S-binding SPASM domain